jgi:hypothetical protein
MSHPKELHVHPAAYTMSMFGRIFEASIEVAGLAPCDQDLLNL